MPVVHSMDELLRFVLRRLSLSAWSDSTNPQLMNPWPQGQEEANGEYTLLESMSALSQKHTDSQLHQAVLLLFLGASGTEQFIFQGTGEREERRLFMVKWWWQDGLAQLSLSSRLRRLVQSLRKETLGYRASEEISAQSLRKRRSRVQSLRKRRSGTAPQEETLGYRAPRKRCSGTEPQEGATAWNWVSTAGTGCTGPSPQPSCVLGCHCGTRREEGRRSK